MVPVLAATLVIQPIRLCGNVSLSQPGGEPKSR
jgi:hypothetical protein